MSELERNVSEVEQRVGQAIRDHLDSLERKAEHERVQDEQDEVFQRAPIKKLSDAISRTQQLSACCVLAVLFLVYDVIALFFPWADPMSGIEKQAYADVTALVILGIGYVVIHPSAKDIELGETRDQIVSSVLNLTSFAVLIGCAAFVPDALWSFLLRCVLLIILAVLAGFARIDTKFAREARNDLAQFQAQLDKDLAEVARKVTEQAAKEQSPEELAKPRCSICKQESQYDICLACEKVFQGERHRVRSQVLRAKQAGTPATLTLPEWLETLQIFHGRCAYCHGDYQLMEHYVPITQGGGTTKDNCVPACFKCNSKKSGKHPEK